MIRDGHLWIEPPNPVLAMWQSVHVGKRPSPDHFYLPKVFVWVPHVTFPWYEVRCGKCGGKGSPKGWPEAPRRAYMHDQVCFIITKRYCCTLCNLPFVPTASEAMKYCPREMIECFPFRLTKRFAITIQALDLFEPLLEGGLANRRLATLFQELHTKRYCCIT